MLAVAGCASPSAGANSPATTTTSSQIRGGNVTATAGPADGPPAYSDNKRHHNRTTLPAVAEASTNKARDSAHDALTKLTHPAAEEDVRTVLASVGAPDPWIAVYPGDGLVKFEAEVDQTGCLVGSVDSAGTVVVDTAGFVLDGGCHALDGH
ncbi:hypothetical protein GCM10025780_08320 [Frondihabitans cladoniiphilus]|uniref:Lipoprotein n=1 Tax=Frondihabitans cladoniiphilus TaxID=715785 RepID=A0ABP8VMT8_9MICO